MVKRAFKTLVLTFGIAVVFSGCQPLSVDAGDDVTTKEGESVTLTCKPTTTQYSRVFYKWLKGSEVVSSNNTYTTPKDLSAGEYEYTCSATNGYSTATDSVVVTVLKRESKEYGLLKTGQSKSYVDFDDGYYQKGATRDFVRDDEKEVVIDKTKQLMWQDDGSNLNIDYEEVREKIDRKGRYYPDFALHQEYCNYLELGGYDNWREPTKDELISLMNFGKKSSLYEDVFQNISPRAYYLSSYIESYWG